MTVVVSGIVDRLSIISASGEMGCAKWIGLVTGENKAWGSGCSEGLWGVSLAGVPLCSWHPRELTTRDSLRCTSRISFKVRRRGPLMDPSKASFCLRTRKAFSKTEGGRGTFVLLAHLCMGEPFFQMCSALDILRSEMQDSSGSSEKSISHDSSVQTGETSTEVFFRMACSFVAAISEDCLSKHKAPLQKGSVGSLGGVEGFRMYSATEGRETLRSVVKRPTVLNPQSRLTPVTEAGPASPSILVRSCVLTQPATHQPHHRMRNQSYSFGVVHQCPCFLRLEDFNAGKDAVYLLHNPSFLSHQPVTRAKSSEFLGVQYGVGELLPLHMKH